MHLLLARLLLAAALLGAIGSTLRAYPHQLAYFNEGAGGRHDGWRHLLGSSLHWGQDIRLASLEGVKLANTYSGDFVILTHSSFDPRIFGLECLKKHPSDQFANSIRNRVILVDTKCLLDETSQFFQLASEVVESSEVLSGDRLEAATFRAFLYRPKALIINH